MPQNETLMHCSTKELYEVIKYIVKEEFEVVCELSTKICHLNLYTPCGTEQCADKLIKDFREQIKNQDKGE